MKNNVFLKTHLLHLQAFHFVYSTEGTLRLNISISDQKGFRFYFAETNKFQIFIQAAEGHVLEKIEKWVHSEKHPTCIFDFFKNVTTAFLYHKASFEFWVLADSMGMNPLFLKRNTSTFEFASMIFPLLEGNPRIDIERIHELLGFGFTLPHSKSLYDEIEKIQKNEIFFCKPGKGLKKEQRKIEWKIGKYNDYDKNLAAESFVKALEDIPNPLLGITSGKDSLAVISAFRAMGRDVSLFNFGNPKSSDVLQAKVLANELATEIHYSSLAKDGELDHILSSIALYSSGRATSSYVDMFKMIDSLDTQGQTVVMGEGGENIRDFFSPSDKPIVQQVASHITPFEAFSTVVDFTFKNEEHYHTYLQELLDQSDFSPENDILLSYYRNVRFPNNFILRSSLLQPLASKFSPFLDREFVKNTFSVDSRFYHQSAVHRSLVEVLAPDFLHYFDDPTPGESDSQNWFTRFQTYVGPHFLRFFQKTEVEVPGLNKDELINLISKNIETPSRDIYLVFRLVTLFYFLEEVSKRGAKQKINFEEFIF